MIKHYLLLNSEGEGIGIFEQQGGLKPAGDVMEITEELEKVRENPFHFKKVKGEIKELTQAEKDTRKKKVEDALPKRRDNTRISDLEARIQLLEGKKTVK